jgi:2-hydroxycyclohexanecarboxyl-CoA dehydrogenase
MHLLIDGRGDVVRTALVTGGAAGIGRACCLRLAEEGLAVGVLDINIEDARRVADAIKAIGGEAIALQASIADRKQVSQALQKCRRALGPITILVNNAAICDFVPFEQVSDELLDRTLAVNLRGTFIVTQEVLPDMKAAGWGRIINISSTSAQTGAQTLSHYSASKGGVIALTRTLAIELGPLGITVNNIPPGSVMHTVLSEANKKFYPISEETLLQTLPVRRTGEPEDIANAVAWLASEASGYVTGQTIGVNGGRVVS